MKNENIARVLKEYRKRSKITVNDVALCLAERNQKVSPKTIYGWESGQSQPDADTLMILCELYNITDVLTAFGHASGDTFHITKAEQELICQFRSHPDMQSAVCKLLDL